jgi:hypothetical protein
MGHTLRKNCLINRVNEGNMEGRVEVTGIRERRRWMISRKQEGTVKLRTKHWIPLCGELTVKEAIDLS